MKVVVGPFKGLRYVERAVGSTVQPKLLGIYERELWECVEQAAKIPFETIIDIGAAEGYYSIGMAMRIPAAKNIAFEMNPAGRELITEMAKLNGVDGRLDVRGRCEAADLIAAIPPSGSLMIVCDVEGHEKVLLDQSAIPALSRAHILVELHEMFVPGITELIRSRFARTHEIKEIKSEARSTDEFPYQSLFRSVTPRRWLIPMVDEYRGRSMSWFWMRPIKGG